MVVLILGYALILVAFSEYMNFKPIFEVRSTVSLVLAARNERNYRSNYHLGQAHYHAKRSK